ncbi:bifunctional phosphoribosylaminoimidazolecarboxamide formyltransferase/IMP cyclohydrolase [Vibrio vulnificus]|uniref:hypothetical protein n=1 Tax=Vibrio vulnificus TaxID=672 RepID=UPI000A2083CB|nr:hypothetical protein [Vibrio vulnificus]ARN64660.1 bifunctional phosphoribosylaminoimidazolecarboxamide formyltransferase/IMP cyclohydrolase [Vibrio vulnificus]EIT7145706.1 hypothetical protein [Vibrio vulnificus]
MKSTIQRKNHIRSYLSEWHYKHKEIAFSDNCDDLIYPIATSIYEAEKLSGKKLSDQQLVDVAKLECEFIGKGCFEEPDRMFLNLLAILAATCCMETIGKDRLYGFYPSFQDNQTRCTSSANKKTLNSRSSLTRSDKERISKVLADRFDYNLQALNYIKVAMIAGYEVHNEQFK